MRIEDGGERAKNYQFGDFFYWDYDGNNWLIECKATRRKSFPLEQLRIGQMARLKLYNDLGHGRKSVIAIMFWDEPISENCDCFMITWPMYEKLYNAAMHKERSSIPREWVERYGTLQEKTKDGWALDFQGVIYE